MIALLLACHAPVDEKPAADPGDDTGVTVTGYSLAGCVVTGEDTFTDTPGTAHWTQTYDDDARIVLMSSVTVYDSGAAYDSDDAFTYDDAGCLVAWTHEQQHASSEGDSVRAYQTTETGSAVCDEHAAATSREITETHLTTLDGETESETSSTRVETIENTWDGDLLTESVLTADDGTSNRVVNGYDDDALPVASSYYDPADAETPEWVWSARYEDGVLVHAETVLETGQSAGFDYTHDELGRVSVRTRTQTDGDDVDVEVVTYAYEGDWPWPAGFEEDEKADGDVDQTETVTYDCP